MLMHSPFILPMHLLVLINVRIFSFRSFSASLYHFNCKLTHRQPQQALQVLVV